MNRNRYERPPFNFASWPPMQSPEGRNRLFFDWWCDDADRQAFITQLGGVPTEVPSRMPLDPDPCPPVNSLPRLGFRQHPVWLLSDPADIRAALTNSNDFGNAPYADLGGGSFLLAQDPALHGPGPDWHGRQRALVGWMLNFYTGAGQPPGSPLDDLAQTAVRQAALTTVVGDAFDLAALAEQAALRYLGQLYGFAVHDHGLLEDASRSVYRALQYVALAQHFVTEPLLLPAARQALARLTGRCSELMQAYTALDRSPRRHGPVQRRRWPEGVVSWSQQPFSGLGEPLLARLPNAPSPFSGRDLATVAATLLAGTAGNIVSAACLVIDSVVDDAPEVRRLKQLRPGAGLAAGLQPLLARRPPLPVVPRRTRRGNILLSNGQRLEQDTDCLVLLEALAGQTKCLHAWGDLGAGTATHPCMGQALTLPLLEHLVAYVLRRKSLVRAVDALTSQPLPLERLWGFACRRLPLMHQYGARDQPGRQRRHNLIVSMRVKSPVGEHAAALRRLIVGAVPRIEQVLRGFQHVEHAWFEFTDGDDQLVLRTVYEGDFDSYIHHFAVQAGDLFDRLFQHIEDAPPMPVAEFPDEFVDTIRRFNRLPVGGYLYGA